MSLRRRLYQLAFPFAGDCAPDLLALAGAAQFDPEARKELDGRKGAEKRRAIIVAALSGVRPVELTDDTGYAWYPANDDDLEGVRASAGLGGRAGVTALQMPDGDEQAGEILTVGGRVLRTDWLADPRSAAKALEGCSRGWETLRVDGRLISAPHRCHSAICPICQRLDAAERAEEWGELIEALVRRDVTVVAATLTQPILNISEFPSDRPVLFTEEEARHYVPHGGNSDGGSVSVRGEPIGMALYRLRNAWELLRKGHASRAWWGSTTFGGVYGIESTSRIGTGLPNEFGVRQAPWLARWHVHMHALILLRPGVELGVCRCARCTKLRDEPKANAGKYAGEQGWWPVLVDEWTTRCTVFGDVQATALAQHVAPVEGENILGAVKECLKYPCKLGDMTRAQVLDWLAVTKGRKWAMPFGALHGSSTIRQVAERDLKLRDPDPEQPTAGE